MHPRVVALTGMFKGDSYRLTGAKLTLGRDNSNAVQLGDTTVSKKHCAIEAVSGSFELVDLDSHNGTFVNGIPVKRRPLVHGDVIRVGNSELLFLTREESQDDAVELQYSDDVKQESLKTVQITLGHQAQSPSDIGRMARDLNALFKIANTINSIRDPGQLQSKLLELIFEVVPAETGAILLMSQVEEEPRAAHIYERHSGAGPALKIRRNVIHRALWERASVFTESFSDVTEAENIMCVPLIGVQNTIGVIYLRSSGLKAQFAEEPRAVPELRRRHRCRYA